MEKSFQVWRIKKNVEAKVTIKCSQVGWHGFKLTVLIPPFVISQSNQEKHIHSCFLNCQHTCAAFLPYTCHWIIAPTHTLGVQSYEFQPAENIRSGH